MDILNCPKCGGGMSVACLTSHPPQYEAECRDRCGFDLRFHKRKNSRDHITQDEINDAYSKRRNEWT